MFYTAGLICYAAIAVSLPNSEYVCKHSQIIVKSARKFKIDPLLIVSLIHRETRWRHKLKGKCGECGLGQIIPKYWKHYGVTCKKLLKYPAYSIYMTAKILSIWIKKRKGNIYLGLCSYNAGNYCRRRKRRKINSKYANKVMATAGKMWVAIRKISPGWKKTITR